MKKKELLPCKKCKKEVEDEIDVCPYCNVEDPTMVKGGKILMWIIIIVMFIFFANLFSEDESEVNSKKITKTEYGNKWAFKQDEAILKCYTDGDIKSPVVELDGIPYGLTGFADNKYGQSDINAMNKHWLDNPVYKGMKVDIGIFMINSMIFLLTLLNLPELKL